jgi:hypothetical protein
MIVKNGSAIARPRCESTVFLAIWVLCTCAWCGEPPCQLQMISICTRTAMLFSRSLPTYLVIIETVSNLEWLSCWKLNQRANFLPLNYTPSVCIIGSCVSKKFACSRALQSAPGQNYIHVLVVNPPFFHGMFKGDAKYFDFVRRENNFTKPAVKKVWMNSILIF